MHWRSGGETDYARNRRAMEMYYTPTNAGTFVMAIGHNTDVCRCYLFNLFSVAWIFREHFVHETYIVVFRRSVAKCQVFVSPHVSSCFMI